MPRNTSYENHTDVDENEDLWRRIHSNQIVPDGKGGLRPMSGAFKGRDISVDLASKTTPQKSIRDSLGLTEFKATIPINLGHRVVEDPIVDDPIIPDNPAHALILGVIDKKKARIIIDNSHWIINPRNESR